MLTSEIAAYLAGLGYGTQGTDIFESQLIDQPDHQIAVFSYGAEPPEFDHDGDLPVLEHPGLQILVRDADYATAMDTALQIFASLCAVKNATLSGTYYMAIHPRQSPFQLPRDDSDRAIVACNYWVSKALSSS